MDYNVVTGDAPDGMEALEIAGRGQRLGAFLVDFLISVVVGIVALAISGEDGDWYQDSEDGRQLDGYRLDVGA